MLVQKWHYPDAVEIGPRSRTTEPVDGRVRSSHGDASPYGNAMEADGARHGGKSPPRSPKGVEPITP